MPSGAPTPSITRFATQTLSHLRATSPRSSSAAPGPFQQARSAPGRSCSPGHDSARLWPSSPGPFAKSSNTSTTTTQRTPEISLRAAALHAHKAGDNAVAMEKWRAARARPLLLSTALQRAPPHFTTATWTIASRLTTLPSASTTAFFDLFEEKRVAAREVLVLMHGRASTRANPSRPSSRCRAERATRLTARNPLLLRRESSRQIDSPSSLARCSACRTAR